MDDIMHKRPVYEVGRWVWRYDQQNTLATATGQRALDKEAMEERIQAKLASKWTSHFKILGVGPCRVGQRFVGPKLLHIDMPFQNITTPRAPVVRCKRCFQPHQKGNKHSFITLQLILYVLRKCSELAPPFYLTTYVGIELESQRVKPIEAHRLYRGQEELLRFSLTTYGEVTKHRSGKSSRNRRFRTYQRLAALRADARSHSSTFPPKGYDLQDNIRHGAKLLTEDMNESHIYLKMAQEGWQLGITQDVETGDNIRPSYTVHFLDLEQRFNVELREGNDTAVDSEAAPLSRCFQTFGRTKSVKRKMV